MDNGGGNTTREKYEGVECPGAYVNDSVDADIFDWFLLLWARPPALWWLIPWIGMEYCYMMEFG